MPIKLGSKVRDSYTGFSGVAVARTEWLYGCARIMIEPTTLKEDGSLIKAEGFDEQRVILIEEAAPEVSPSSEATTGGSYPDPDRGR